MTKTMTVSVFVRGQDKPVECRVVRVRVMTPKMQTKFQCAHEYIIERPDTLEQMYVYGNHYDE